MLNPDYRDILFAFSEAGVKYLLDGAYAMAAHGEVRASGDSEERDDHRVPRRSRKNTTTSLELLSYGFSQVLR